MTDVSHEGGCLCGAVRYRSTAEPRALTHCHCRSCRLAAGSPSVAWAVFPAEAFAFVAGTPTWFRSSPGVVRGFCGACGTTLSWQREDRPETVDVTSATLDRADAFAPRQEIWVEDKLVWDRLDPTLPHHPRSSTSDT